MTEPIVVAKDVTKIYGEGGMQVRALDEVLFTFQPGEFVVLPGTSGSGKTTLVNQVGALEAATSGIPCCQRR